VAGDSQTAMSELEVGTYWQGELNGIVADARVGAGYTWMAGRREFIETDSSGDIALDRKAKSDWDGYTLSGHFGLAYKWILPERFLGGGWFMQPQTHFDYFRLNESAYSENQAQSIGTLALAIASRTGQESSGTASILFGRKLGTGIVFRPELELGVRDVFSGDAGDTTARYLSGGSAFTLTPADITGTAGVARFRLKASSEYYEVGVEAGGEILSSRYQEGDMKMTVRVLF
jgi:outer membrane autotransporter protein